MNFDLLDDDNLGLYKKRTYPTKWERFGAFVIDNIIVTVVMFLIEIIIVETSLLYNVLVAIVLPLYKIIMEGRIGQTIGKKILNIKVVRDEATLMPITLGDANNRFCLWWPMYIGLLLYTLSTYSMADRHVLVIMSALVMLAGCLLYMGSCFSIFLNNNGKTWHDKVGKTICIKLNSLKN